MHKLSTWGGNFPDIATSQDLSLSPTSTATRSPSFTNASSSHRSSGGKGTCTMAWSRTSLGPFNMATGDSSIHHLDYEMTLHLFHRALLTLDSEEAGEFLTQKRSTGPQGRGGLPLRLFCLSPQTPHFQRIILNFHKIHKTLSPACGREFLDVLSGRSPKLN